MLGRSLSHGLERSVSNSSFSFAKANESLVLHTCKRYSSHDLGSPGTGGIALGSISFEMIKDDDGMVRFNAIRYLLASVVSISSTALFFCYKRHTYYSKIAICTQAFSIEHY